MTQIHICSLLQVTSDKLHFHSFKTPSLTLQNVSVSCRGALPAKSTNEGGSALCAAYSATDSASLQAAVQSISKSKSSDIYVSIASDVLAIDSGSWQGASLQFASERALYVRFLGSPSATTSLDLRGVSRFMDIPGINYFGRVAVVFQDLHLVNLGYQAALSSWQGAFAALLTPVNRVW